MANWWLSTVLDLEHEYPLVFKEAVEESKRQYPSRSDFEVYGHSLGGFIDWSMSRMGSRFWSMVCSNYWDILKLEYPQMFIEKKKEEYKGVEINNNGLFIG